MRPDLVYRLFYPQVPAILCSKAIRVAAMPVVSAMPVSHDPLIIAVSVKRGNATNEVMRKSKTFSLNWIDFRKRRLVARLAEAGRSKDKLKAYNIPYYTVLNSPVLKDALAFAILKKERVIRIGDHDLFFGLVIGAMASLDFDLYWKFKKYSPILYLGSRGKSFVSI